MTIPFAPAALQAQAFPWPDFAVLLTICVVAAWSDTFQRRLPNLLSIAAWSAGLALAVLHERQGAGGNLVHAVAALLAGMLLFRMGVLGGGDAKFYAAIAAWFPIGSGLALAVNTSLAGLLAALVWFAARRLAGGPIDRRSDTPFAKFPFGVAIALGALTTFWIAHS